MQLIVLGMHRSGTSVVTRLLSMMGAYCGPEGVFTGANDENPKGFWERRDIRDRNDAILSSAGYQWNKVSNFSIESISESEKEKYCRAVSRIILELDAHRPWVVKEPRLCLLFPLWRDLLEVPFCIHVHRNPLEVARSLAHRNGMPVCAGVALWELYNLSALSATSGLPRMLLSYADILADPVSSVERLYQELRDNAVTGLHVPGEREIRAFVSEDLHRQRLNGESIEAFANSPQQRLLEALETGATLQPDRVESISKGALDILALYEKEESADKKLSELDEQLRREHHKLEKQREKIDALQAQHRDFETQHQALHTWHEALQEQYDHLDRRYSAFQSQHKNLQDQFRKRSRQLRSAMGRMEDLKTAIPPLFASRTWRGARFLSVSIRRLSLKRAGSAPDKRILGILDDYNKWRENVKIVTRNLRRPLTTGEAERSTDGKRLLNVDIVICVHNALEDVRMCLESVEENTSRPYCLYLVDDGSGDETRALLENYSRRNDHVTLLRNNDAQGYTKAANKGMRQCDGDYVVLLNSDTMVPRMWVEALIECAECDWQIGIVGPLSNAASWQSVPTVMGADDDWAVNELPDGFSVNEMTELVHWQSKKRFPRVPLLNGFCMLIKRSVVDVVGYFDEENFPKGYGEENDYCLRAAQAGFTMAIADHLYVYHAKSKSYAHGRRSILAAEGQATLRDKHAEIQLGPLIDKLREQPVLADLRASIDARLNSAAFL